MKLIISGRRLSEDVLTGRVKVTTEGSGLLSCPPPPPSPPATSQVPSYLFASRWVAASPATKAALWEVFSAITRWQPGR